MEQYSFSGSPLSTQLQSSVNSFLQSKGWYRPNQIETIQQSARLNPIGTLKGTLPGLNLDTDGSLSNQLSITGALGASTVQAPSVSDVTSSLADSITNNPIQSVNKSLTTNPISNINITNPDAKLSFSQKFQNSTFGKNFGLWSAGLNMANNLFTGIAGPKSEYEGAKGDITQTMDSAYDAIQGAAGMFGPVGQAVSLGMGANKLLGNVANKLGAGTDAMTSTDAILGSSFLQLTPFGLVNGFGGKKADTITKDEQAFEQVGSSYGGTQATVNDALTKSGKKYGAFSSGARREANREIAEAKRQQGIMSNIADEATDRFAIQGSTAAINENRRAFQMTGGYNPFNIRVGKSGMSLELMAKAKKILHESRKLKEGGQITPTKILLVVPEFQQGGQIQASPTEILLIVPEFQDGGQINKKSRTLQELIEYAKKKNPRFIQRMSEPLKYVEWIDKDGKTTHGTHELTYSKDDNGYFIFPMIQENNKGNLVRYTNWREAYDNAFKNKNGLYVDTKDEAELFTVSGQNDDGTFYGYKAGWPEFFNQKPTKYKEGGSINVIPEGALHARKHNMDMEGITKKGIPVISDKEGGEVEQQAEIEREEIIFRLEVTKKLEELEKKFYDDDTSQKEKDECALEAGKLLVEEILYNTQDNTGKLI